MQTIFKPAFKRARHSERARERRREREQEETETTETERGREEERGRSRRPFHPFYGTPARFVFPKKIAGKRECARIERSRRVAHTPISNLIFL